MALVAAGCGWVGGGCIYFAVYGVEVAAGWAGMIVPRGYRRFGDGWVRFNRISNILPIRRLHPARTFFQTTIRRIFTPSVECAILGSVPVPDQLLNRCSLF
jgi:hypothetical protein